MRLPPVTRQRPYRYTGHLSQQFERRSETGASPGSERRSRFDGDETARLARAETVRERAWRRGDCGLIETPRAILYHPPPPGDIRRTDCDLLLASPIRRAREAIPKGAFDATLRSGVHGPSGPERAGPGDDRTVSFDGRIGCRLDPPARRLGTAPARLPDPQGSQGSLRPHEYRVHASGTRRNGQRVQIQRRGHSPPHHSTRFGGDGSVAAREVEGEGRERGTGRPGQASRVGRQAARGAGRGPGPPRWR